MASRLLQLLVAPALALAAAPPTVIWNVIIDDLGHANVGWHTPNPPENLTPRLHALASAGVILERQYNHFTCTPSRSAFATGRLPVHVQTTLDNPNLLASGIPVNMTTLPLKLAQAGYFSALVGKYDMGFASRAHLPRARGYNRSLVYAEHMNNYWSKKIEPTGTNCNNASLLDLWEDDAPAPGLAANASQYIDDLFQQRALAHIADFVAARAAGGPQRLYLDYRPHSMHWPLSVDEASFAAHAWVGDDEPGCRARFYGDSVWPGGASGPAAFACRRQYQAMLSNLDARIGAVADALVAAGLWGETLMLLQSDNGGCVDTTENAANNWPLRGGKYHAFEGGVRVASMWSGGYLPPAARGTTSHALVSVADYYATLCGLAGLGARECAADPLAAAAGLPRIGSQDVWLAVTGGGASGRTELPIAEGVLLSLPAAGGAGPWWKLFTDASVPGAGWTGPVFPNATSPNPEEAVLRCAPGGCLFDVLEDPTEAHDVAAAHPDVVAALGARLAELRKGFYSNSDTGGTPLCPRDVADAGQCMCWAAANTHGGVLGPYHEWP